MNCMCFLWKCERELHVKTKMNTIKWFEQNKESSEIENFSKGDLHKTLWDSVDLSVGDTDWSVKLKIFQSNT